MIKYIFTLFLLVNIAFANNLKSIIIQLNWKHQFQFAGYYIAKEKGFYKDAGFDVKLKEFDGKTDLVEHINNNKADYSISSLAELLRNKIENKDIISIFALFESSPLVFLVREDSNINSIEDFKGKILQTNIHEKGDLALNMILLKHGVNMEDLKTVPHTFNIDKLEDKSVDIMTVYTTTEPFLLEQKNIKYRIFSPKDYGFDVYADILFTKSSRDKNEINKIKEATIKGWKYALEHQEEAINLILEKYNTRDLTREFLEFEAINTKKLTYQKNKVGHIDKTKVLKVSNLINLMIDNKNNINIDEFIFQKSININLSKYQKEYLKNKKEITVCLDSNKMPIESIDKDGNYTGINKDYIDIFEKKLSVKFNILNTNSLENLVKSKECDIVSLMMKTKEKEKYFNFTNSYLKNSIVIATKNSVSFIDNINSIKDKRIAISEDCASYEFIKDKFPNLNIIKVKNIDNGLQKLINDDVFAYVGALSTIDYYIEQNHIKSIKISGKLSITCNLGIAVQENNLILFNILQKAVNSITEQEHKQILSKWRSLKYEEKIDYELIVKIIIIFSVILVILLIMYFKTKQLKDELEIAKNKAEESTKLKSQFLANMSHEIRTPINGIIGMSQLAINSKDSNKIKDYIQKIDLSAKNLLGIINDILDFSKIEADKLTIEKSKINLHDIIDNVISLISFTIDKKDINLSVKYEKNIHKIFLADSLRISQILINLLSNAVKFTEQGEVKLIVTKIKTNRYKFQIQDTGIGLTKEQISKLFKSFSQADSSTTKKYGGTGLGLAISKKLVELMNGKIWVESQKDIGSNFIFEIDLEELYEEQNHNLLENENINYFEKMKKLKKAKILLVEDNEINQEIMLASLKESSLDIDIANNGQIAVEKAKQNNYELILMDIQMPIMDGYEATKEIRSLNINTPIIALTANIIKEDFEKGKSVGMNEYLLKPIELDKLYSVLLKFIKKGE